MRRLQWLALAMVLNASPTAAQVASMSPFNSPDTTTINAMGVGEVSVSPTRAVAFIAITSGDTSASGAVLANGERRAKVVEALAAAGFDESQVVLWGYGSGPATPRGRPVGTGPAVGFEAKSGVRVVVEPVNRLDEVVVAALLAGAEGTPLVQFEAPDSEDAHRDATKIAVANARVTAEAMAEAAGGRLGALRHLTTIPDYGNVIGTSRLFAGGIPGQGVQLIPSSLSVTVQVQASWVFVPR